MSDMHYKLNINNISVVLPVMEYDLMKNLTVGKVAGVIDKLRITSVIDSNNNVVKLDPPIYITKYIDERKLVGIYNKQTSCISLTTYNSDIKEVIFEGDIVERKSSSDLLINNTNDNEREELLKNLEIALRSIDDKDKLTHILTSLSNDGALREFKGKEIAQDIGEMLQMKNSDYGSAVYDDYKKLGIVSILTSLNHKMNRLINITKKGQCDVSNESFVDTLKDLAGYAICGLDAIGYHHDIEVK